MKILAIITSYFYDSKFLGPVKNSMSYQKKVSEKCPSEFVSEKSLITGSEPLSQEMQANCDNKESSYVQLL